MNLRHRLNAIAALFQRRPATGRLAVHPRRFAHLESLEDRILFSVDLVGIPTWVDQGPGPITNGQIMAAPDNRVAGAVEAIVIHPTLPNRAYAASVAGGVWRTDNLNAADPADITWTPETDRMSTLAISAIAFSPLDSNVLFAGTGSYSNTFRNSIQEMAQGLLRTTDAGATWTPLAQASFQNDRIRAVVPTAIGGTLATQVVLVAADDGGGVWRSADGGASFTQISGAVGSGLPGGSASDLIGDPNDTQRFYAALPNQGIFRSDDSGQTWAMINAGLAGVAGSANIELATHDAGATTVLYVGIVDGTGVLSGVFRDAAGDDGVNDDGDGQTDEADETNWTVIGAAPPAIHGGKQGVNNFTIVADPANPNRVYVGGDRPPHVFRGDATAGTWTSIVGAGASGNTRPHADSRDLVFVGNTLYETDDGGIYRINDPANAAANTWISANGNIRITEFHSISYDSGDNFIFGGSQDNGSEAQTAAGSQRWTRFTDGDGSTQAYDAAGDIRYSLGNNFGTFQRNGTQLQMRAAVGGAANFDGLENTSGTSNDRAFATSDDFNSGIPVAINTITPAQILFARRGLYESTDRGDTITDLTASLTGKGATERVISLAYGGRRAATDFAGIFYAGTDGGRLYVRDEANAIVQRNIPGASGQVKDIVIDREDWRIAYVIQGNNVYFTTNAGQNWTALEDATNGNLDQLSSELRSITLVDDTAATGDGVVMIGAFGGVFRDILGDSRTFWTEFGTGLPNMIVQDLRYDLADDLLIAGTFGRGAWTVSTVSNVADVIGQIVVNGDTDFPNEDDTITLRRSTNPLYLDVTLNAATTSVEWAAVESIQVDGLGGTDLLVINLDRGDAISVSGVAYDGGDGTDTLDLQGATFAAVTYAVTGPTSGSVALGASDVVTYTGVQQVIDRTTATDRSFNATAGDDTIRIVDDGIFLNGRSRIDDGGAGDFAQHDFADPSGSLSVNGGGGADDIHLVDTDILFSATVNLSGGAGNDGITVDFGAGINVVNVTGDGDDDTLLVNGTAVDDTVFVTGTVVTRGAQAVNYDVTVEHLIVDGGTGNDDFTIDGAAGEILGGAGLDTYLVIASAAPQLRLNGQADSDDYTVNFGSLAGPVIVQDLGALGTDTLLINGTGLDDTIVVTAADVTSGTETIAYSSIEELTVNAGDGKDSITIDGTSAGLTTILGGNGDDAFVVNGSGPGSLKLDGEEGSDSYTINLGGALTGPIAIEDTGTTGTDSLLINGTSGDDWIILTDTGFIVDGLPASFTFAGIELLTVNAGAGDDIVDGSALTMMVTIFGGTGDDTLIGGSNDDHLYGEDDDDDLIGNLGADFLDGGAGSDALIGDQCVQGDKGRLEHEAVIGPARILSIPSGKLAAVVDVPGTNRRLVTLRDETLGGVDTLIGGTGDDYAYGGAGNDVIRGGDDADALFGNLGDDDIGGDDGDDHLYGGSGNDLLNGNAGADIAYGGDGDDRLVADVKADRLIDWFGNFNDFVVPGPGYGAPTIVRSPSPWVQDFLLNLARADGAANPNSQIVVVVPGGDLQQSNSGKGGRT
jgi:hypothetical protein